MRTVLAIALLPFLVGCGVEMMGAAATAAKTKAEEAKHAKQTIDRARKQLDAMRPTQPPSRG